MQTPPLKRTLRISIHRSALATSIVLPLLLLAVCAQAQWRQQSISLRPGWNAVFLDVQPEPATCDELFAGLPIESVWDFNRVVDLPQFVQDPTTLTPNSPGWLTWFPANHPLAAQGSLYILRDSRSYLIKMASNAAPISWTVTGRPSLRRTAWIAGGLNLAGFHVGASGPTFQNLFAGESGLAGQPVYSLDTAGVWRRFLDLSTARPKAGESYWIRCTAPAQRAGTIVIDAGARDGLIFQGGGTELSLRVRNASAAPRNITLRMLPSAMPPSGRPMLAGPVPLEYWRSDYANTNFGWTPLSSTLSFNALPSGQEWQIRLGARIQSHPPLGAEFQSLIEITDDAGTRWIIPVRASSPLATPSGGGLVLASVLGNVHAGLWVGEAVIRSVSQPADSGDATTPRPAGSEYSFRLIVHVDASGQARLMSQAFVVRKPAVLGPDPDNPESNRVVEEARTVVLSDEGLIPAVVGNGEIAGRRLSSTTFGFQDPLVLSGAVGGGSPLTGVVQLDYNHPRNPFKHGFHPDHNNLDERFEQTLPEGKESFTVIRALSLEFTAADPLGLNPPGWGAAEMGGNYRETIHGLHRNDLHISGTFRLSRVTQAPALNE